MASSSLEVNNSAKTEDLGFTVGKLTKVSAVILLEVDLCKFISQGQFYCLVCVFTSGYWMSTCSPGVGKEKKRRFQKFSSKDKTKQSSSRGKYLYRG